MTLRRALPVAHGAVWLTVLPAVGCDLSNGPPWAPIHFSTKLIMSDSLFYAPAGNLTTYVGAAALFSVPILMIWIFRSFYNSPVNISYRSHGIISQSDDVTESNDQ